MWLWLLAWVTCSPFAPFAMVPLAIAGPASAEVRMAAVPRIARLSFVMGHSLFVIRGFHNERRDADVPPVLADPTCECDGRRDAPSSPRKQRNDHLKYRF